MIEGSETDRSAASARLTLPAVIVAAGRSARMGTAKALLDADGRTFLHRVSSALREGGCDPLFVVVGDGQGPVAAAGAALGLRVLENRDPGEGPITSIRLALQALAPSAPGFVLAPVDHPCVLAETVSRLGTAFLASVRQGDPPAAVVPIHEGKRGHPIVVGRRLFAELLDPELVGGARAVIRRHGDDIRPIEVSDEGVLVDIDTRTEYRRRFPASFRRRFQSR